jgi:hypothetical protein
MKLQTLILVLLTILFNRTIAQDKLEWSESRKLTLNDFKGPAPDPAKKQSLIVNFGLETNLSEAEIRNSKTLNRLVTNVFSASDSWIDRTDKSRLLYANTLFDLGEWRARELRKRLQENRKSLVPVEHGKIVEAVNREFLKIQQDYNSESDSGNNPIGQLKWETRIHESLQALADYCKRCGAGKDGEPRE